MNLSISKVFWLFWLFSPFGPPKKLKQPSTVALSVAKFNSPIIVLVLFTRFGPTTFWFEDRSLSQTIHFDQLAVRQDSTIFHFRTVYFRKLSTLRQRLWPQVLGAKNQSLRPIYRSVWPITVHISRSDIWISNFYWSGYHLEYFEFRTLKMLFRI